MIFFKVIAGVVLLIALARLPYGYYITLRWIVTISAAISIFHAFEKGKSGWGWIFIAIAILFNPFFPIHLNKSIWSVIDIIVAVIFFYSVSAVEK